MVKSSKKPMTFHVGPRNITLIYPYDFSSSTPAMLGQTMHDEDEIRLSKFTSGGQEITFESKLVTLFHELCHAWSMTCGHGIFEDDDQETNKQKEDSLEGFSNLMVQTLLQGNMLNPEWLDKVVK